MLAWSQGSQRFTNSLPNDKILDWSKLKGFADDKINVIQKLKFVVGLLENIVGKGENAGYQHFLLFPQCFRKASPLKVVIMWQRVKSCFGRASTARIRNWLNVVKVTEKILSIM